MRQLFVCFYSVLFFAACGPPKSNRLPVPTQPFITVLGIAQDAGYPQAGCNKTCCAAYWSGIRPKAMVASLGIVDPVSGQKWLIDCTPSFPEQWYRMEMLLPEKTWSGIFLTHAHMGHYAGLLHLGREAMNAQKMPVFCDSVFARFLETNGPFSQLVKLENIVLHPIMPDQTLTLNERISITPFTGPHRDEFSPTFGYRISSAGKKIIFIPDIDKWEKWDSDIVQWVKENDLLFLDGTFFREGEIPGRNMSEIPHPFVSETMQLMAKLPPEEKQKIHFIHFNHTNPLIFPDSPETEEIKKAGFNCAREGMMFELN
jgi:pyrroloquinoline quinone biosynthesis protein B